MLNKSVIFLVIVIFFLTQIYSLENLPKIHHLDLINNLKEIQKRSLFDEHQFFIISGIQHKNEELEFILQKSSPLASNFTVRLDGEKSDVKIDSPLFVGNVVSDPRSIVVLSFPKFDKGENVPAGMVHWSSGESHALGSSDKLKRDYDGIHLHSLLNSGNSVPVERLCRNIDHQGPTLSTFNETVKRDVENNGITSFNGENYVIKLAIETNVAFLRDLFNNDQSAATAYLRTVVAAVNVMYKRDFYAELSLTNVGYHTSDVASDGSSMATYLKDKTSIVYDVAQFVKGGQDGGYGLIGTVCERQYAYSDVGFNGVYGSSDWNAIHDPYIMGHEIGHNLNSGHTHDSSSYNPVIDSCGNGGAVPSDKGTIMSYCVTRPAISGCSSTYCNLVLSMGEVGQHGYQSERVNQVIRAHLQSKRTCFSLSSGSNPVPVTVPTPVAPTPTKAPVPTPVKVPSGTTGTTTGTSGGTVTLLDQTQYGALSVWSEYASDKSAYIDCADDFTVPAGKSWTITQIVAGGMWSSTGASKAYVIIRPDSSGYPSSSSTTYSYTYNFKKTLTDGTLTIPISYTLSAGTYWISVYPELPSTSYWYWYTASTSNGNSFKFRDAAKIVRSGCTSWSPIANCVSGVSDRDLYFKLIGTVA